MNKEEFDKYLIKEKHKTIGAKVLSAYIPNTAKLPYRSKYSMEESVYANVVDMHLMFYVDDKLTSINEIRIAAHYELKDSQIELIDEIFGDGNILESSYRGKGWRPGIERIISVNDNFVKEAFDVVSNFLAILKENKIISKIPTPDELAEFINLLNDHIIENDYLTTNGVVYLR